MVSDHNNTCGYKQITEIWVEMEMESKAMKGVLFQYMYCFSTYTIIAYDQNPMISPMIMYK